MSEQNNFDKIMRSNLLLVIGGAVAFGLLSRLMHGTSMLLFAFGYMSLVLINIVLGFNHIGRGAAPYFLSALLVLIIGFGSCTGMFMYLNINGGPQQ